MRAFCKNYSEKQRPLFPSRQSDKSKSGKQESPGPTNPPISRLRRRAYHNRRPASEVFASFVVVVSSIVSTSGNRPSLVFRSLERRRILAIRKKKSIEISILLGSQPLRSALFVSFLDGVSFLFFRTLFISVALCTNSFFGGCSVGQWMGYEAFSIRWSKTELDSSGLVAERFFAVPRDCGKSLPPCVSLQWSQVSDGGCALCWVGQWMGQRGRFRWSAGCRAVRAPHAG